MLGIVGIVASRLPANSVVVPHPDQQLADAGVTITAANPTLAIGGWLAMLFGIVHLTVRPGPRAAPVDAPLPSS